MGPQFTFFLMLGTSVLAGAVVGAVLIGNGWKRAFAAVFAAHLFAAVGMVVAVSQGNSHQGAGFAFALIMLVFPSMLGMVLGGGVMLWRGRRTER